MKPSAIFLILLTAILIFTYSSQLDKVEIATGKSLKAKRIKDRIIWEKENENEK